MLLALWAHSAPIAQVLFTRGHNSPCPNVAEQPSAGSTSKQKQKNASTSGHIHITCSPVQIITHSAQDWGAQQPYIPPKEHYWQGNRHSACAFIVFVKNKIWGFSGELKLSRNFNNNSWIIGKGFDAFATVHRFSSDLHFKTLPSIIDGLWIFVLNNKLLFRLLAGCFCCLQKPPRSLIPHWRRFWCLWHRAPPCGRRSLQNFVDCFAIPNY